MHIWRMLARQGKLEEANEAYARATELKPPPNTIALRGGLSHAASEGMTTYVQSVESFRGGRRATICPQGTEPGRNAGRCWPNLPGNWSRLFR